MNKKLHALLQSFLLRAGCSILAAFLIVALAGFTPAKAAIESVICTPTSDADSDGDGLSDAEENAGIIINGVSYAVDPSVPDAFIEVRAADSSKLPADLDFLKYLRESGFNMTFHLLPENTLGDERILVQRDDGTCQKAILVKEVRTPGSCFVSLGKTEQGPVNNDEGPVLLYTDRIECFVNTINECATRGDACKSNTTGNTGAQAIINELNLFVIAHESGHRLKLGPYYNSRFGGNHFKEGEGVTMEQFLKVTNRKSGVTFYISEQFSDASLGAAALK